MQLSLFGGSADTTLMCSVLLLLACTQVSAAAEVLYAFSFMKFGLF